MSPSHDTETGTKPSKKTGISYQTLSRIGWRLFALALLWILALEFLVEAHSLFGIDGTPFFYAWFGFFSCLGLILCSKFTAMFLRKPLDYYDEKHYD